jgi:hypothetical protein
MGWVMPASEKSRHPPDALPEGKAGTPARPSLKVRFRKPLSTLQLTATRSVLPQPQVQPRFGRGYHSPTPQQNPLAFFSLLPRSTTHHPPHNRTVCL